MKLIETPRLVLRLISLSDLDSIHGLLYSDPEVAVPWVGHVQSLGEFRELTGETTGESSATVRERVIAARARQAVRLAGSPAVTNSEMGPLQVRKFCQEPLVPAAQPLLSAAMEQLGLSARAFHRVLKVARTIADLADSDAIETVHLAEAIQYRRRGAD